MNIAQAVKKKINSMPKGEVFGYDKLPAYSRFSGAVITTVNRLVAEKKVERLAKGKFYIPQKGLLGPKKPSEKEILRSILYKNDRLVGYVTGPSLYNKFRLTTQIPNTITIACLGSFQKQQFNSIRIKKVTTRIPIDEENIEIIQYLDVLKEIKKIPDSNINLSLKRMQRLILKLSKSKQKSLIDFAVNYYPAQVKALVGLILSSANLPTPRILTTSLNPITTYKLNLDQSVWPKANEWNIK